MLLAPSPAHQLQDLSGWSVGAQCLCNGVLFELCVCVYKFEFHGLDTTLFYLLIHPHLVPVCPASPYSPQPSHTRAQGAHITCLSCGADTPVQVVQDHAEEFLEKMNSKVLEPQLKALELIPESVECDICQSKSREEANVYLLNHLK